MKRMLILDTGNGDDYCEYVRGIIDDNDLSDKLEVVQYHESCNLHLPRGFDLYLIHFSETSIEAIQELKEIQPWCNISIVTGAIMSKPKFVDNMRYVLLGNDIKFILAEIGINVPSEY